MTSLVNYEELDRQIAVTQEEVDGLKQKLHAAQVRLVNLSNIRVNAQALDEAPDPDVTFFPSIQGFIEADVVRGLGQVRQEADGVVVLGGQSSRKRIRSTEMVADVVKEADVPLTRDEIFTAFENTYGFPETWTNPRNALNNAIARATEKGLIVQDDDEFISREAAERLVADKARMENGDA
ncbi:hypothetical protein VD659_16240 [Herbiconiux sp. 11R-BC]|uniref:hypothetical protein n=1 Tax=Herbiconiux sp. 11R-BC TaxID=3111637 RepID=UPI003C0BCA9A